MNTVTVTLGSIIDRVLFDMQDPASAPLLSSLYAAITDEDTTLSLADASAVNISDILEIGSELLLVTGKTEDAVPVLTVSRGYYSSTAVAHDAGTPVAVNPLHARVRIAEAIKRSLSRLEALGLPLISTDTYQREVGLRFIELPEETRDVLRVGYLSTEGRWFDLSGWTFVDTVPTSVATTGKMLRLSRLISDDDELHVTIRTPYRWSTFPDTPDESATITMLEGTEDLPAVYAMAWLMSRRELARIDVQRAQEWNAAEPTRSGVSTAVVRLQWQEFYRALDEAKRLAVTLPVHRPYVPMPRLY